jgi:hypothetical protein
VVVTAIWPVQVWHRVYPDFWPLDASRVGPNLVASVVQWLLIALVAVVVYPPLRAFVRRQWTDLHGKVDHLAANHDETIRHLGHIIEHHPDIPPLPPAP